ncbi:MAG TPA: thioredoxin domain-containing protein [Bryobacteraceae bacterium]|nr:thioredoxin domain-containing protein [Bryobacteraceae bacterium]
MTKATALLIFAALAAAPGGYSAAGKALGNPKAPVRIDLYSDFQCPSCKVFHDGTFGPLVAKYVMTGKVYLRQHEYPLPMHAHAREAACLACAADKCGRYWQVCDALFQTQDSWAKDGKVAAAACSVLTPIEAAQVQALARTPAILDAVNDDIRSGQTEQVNGTPTMIITKLMRRYPVAGPVSFPVLSRFLDSLIESQ